MKTNAYKKKISQLRNIVARKILLYITQITFMKNHAHSYTRSLVHFLHPHFANINIYHNIWYLDKNNLEK